MALDSRGRHPTLEWSEKVRIGKAQQAQAKSKPPFCFASVSVSVSVSVCSLHLCGRDGQYNERKSTTQPWHICTFCNCGDHAMARPTWHGLTKKKSNREARKENVAFLWENKNWFNYNHIYQKQIANTQTTDRQKDRQTERWADRKMGRQKDRQTRVSHWVTRVGGRR